MPIIPHLISEEPDTLVRMVERLENLEGIMGIELGMPPAIDGYMLHELVNAVLGELPVIIRLPFEKCVDLAATAVDAGGNIVSIAPPRGTMPGPSGELISGRLYGPAIFPMAVNVVRALRALDIQVIAAGGIYTQEQVEIMMGLGALAVQLNAVLWREPRSLSSIVPSKL
jgi:dihydroorotate dehydrogenase (NAD+) catalytic subunit